MPFSKGIKFTDEHRAKLRLAASRPRPWRIGFKHSEESKLKIGIAKIGNTYRRGKKMSIEVRDRIKKTLLAKFIDIPKKIGIVYQNNEWRELRKEVYRRDGWKCQECGVRFGAKHRPAAHHIDYDTSNNNLSNLISLCSSCHGKTNYKKEEWTNYYKKKMDHLNKE